MAQQLITEARAWWQQTQSSLLPDIVSHTSIQESFTITVNSLYIFLSLCIYTSYIYFLLNEQKELLWNVRPVGKWKFFLNVSPGSIFTLVWCWDWSEYYYYVLFVIFLVSCLVCMIARYIAYSVLSFLDSSTPPSPKADSVDYTLSYIYIYKVPLVVN